MLFDHDYRADSSKTRQYAFYEIAYTSVDFLAAVLFIIGSIMFFYEDLQYQGTWMFLIGSICFAAKPTIRLVRDIHLAALGDDQDLAKRASGQ